MWELTANRGVDHVIEVGGAGTLPQSFQSARYGGRVSLIGVLSRYGGEVNPLPVLCKRLRLVGIYVGSREMFEARNRAIAQAKNNLVIDRVFPLHEVQAAHHHFQSVAHVGKVVITI